MRRLIICLTLILLMTTTAVHAKITLPPMQEVRLSNGLTIQVIERHNLPLFSLRLTFRAGSVYDPAGRDGLAGLVSEMLMRGTKNRTDKQIVAEIALGGSTLNVYCDREKAGFSGEFLSDQGEKGFEILGDIMTNSLFAQEEVEKIKTRIVAMLQGELEQPAMVANRYFNTTVLGASRYAHEPSGSMAMVNKLTRDDVVDYFKRHCTPENAVLIVCGDITPQVVEQWAKKYLQEWKGSAGTAASEPAFTPVTGTEILLLDKSDATQTQIRIGNLGLSRKNPDYIPLEAARTIFGGSFTSRLVNEIRVNRGLSYNVRCTSARYSPGGVFSVSTFTKNETVGEVVDIIMNESKRMQTELVPDSELTGAINYRNGLYPLGFETNESLADIFASLWLYGEDKTQYENFQEQMRQVKPPQVMEVAKKYFPQTDFRLVLVGKADAVKSQVEKFGPVTVQPIATE
ncbi:MAG: pitrilysin family protein [candidate division Zixibacteria bacterium]|nr:pitrilysin family protein [candidate division Zixibacteria bacterium]